MNILIYKVVDSPENPWSVSYQLVASVTSREALNATYKAFYSKEYIMSPVAQLPSGEYEVFLHKKVQE